MNFEEIHRQKLADLISQRDQLNAIITSLTYELEHPSPPIKIDFEQIKAEAKRFLAILYKCSGCGETLTDDERLRFNCLIDDKCKCDTCKGVLGS